MGRLLGISAAAALLAATFAWLFRVLPGERWQVIAASPVARTADGEWRGVNWTFYGFFTATALATGIALGLALMASVGIPVGVSASIALVLLAAGLPSARYLARIIERTRNTFTVGGAMFIGVLLTPWLVAGASMLSERSGWGTVAVLPALAALTIALAVGEAIGRLACISFGCCYGKRIDDCSPWVQRLLRGVAFTFRGATRKASYTSGLEGVPLVPVQGITAIVLSAIALIALLLFLEGRYLAAAAVSGVGVQAWRVLSEFLRADPRGEGRLSAYQKMAVVGSAYMLGALLLLDRWFPEAPLPDVASALGALWRPEVIVGLQLLWAGMFIYSGRSVVTSARLSFSVVRD